MTTDAAATTGSGLEVRLLGPVEVVRNGATVAIGGPRQRALLGLLATQARRTAAIDWLIDELWSGEPPDGADVTLRSYVSRLRSVIGADAPIRGTGAGYTLDVPPAAVDGQRFEALIREARERVLRRNYVRAREQLREALALWRGRPFGELSTDGALRVEAERLEELRLEALELRIDADLEIGAAGGLADELEELVRQHPYREAFWRQLMLSLYRSQRQADALAAYHRARSALADDLGIEPGAELRALEAAILRQDVPGPAPAAARQNLPAPLSSFVGRESELGELERLLGSNRLVTLTGIGGVGKTRLAIEAASRIASDHADGAAFIDLAPLSDPELLAANVAASMEIREQPGVRPIDGLVSQLRERAVLVVLDNCEHLRDACADLAAAVLRSCPSVRILATSREPLGVPGEVDFPVAPLGLAAGESEAAIRASEAVQLFLARTRAARPGLGEDAASLAVAARICADLDGIPLALELAAARAKALSLADIADRIADRFRFLVSWRPLSASRHQTLREAMAWSFQLLADEEQQLMRRLSIFAGGFRIADAAAVCVDGDEDRTLAPLQRVVDASLVVVEDVRGDARYRLLETVRQYAAEQLAIAGEADAVARRHAEHFAALADDRTRQVRTGKNLTTAVRDIDRDRDNARAALAWTRDRGDWSLNLRLAESHWYFWWIRGDLREGRGWLEPAIANATDPDPSLAAHANHGVAGLAWAQGDLDAAWRFGEHAREIFQRLGSATDEAGAANTLALVALSRGDLARAEVLLREALALRATDPDPHSRALNSAIFLNNLGEVALARGDLTAATAHISEARALYADAGDDGGIGLADLNLGAIAVREGRVDAARKLLASAVARVRDIGFPIRVAEAVEEAAGLAILLGATREAAVLLGGSGRIRDETGAPPIGANVALRERELGIAREALGDVSMDAALMEGGRLSASELADRALDLLAT